MKKYTSLYVSGATLAVALCLVIGCGSDDRQVNPSPYPTPTPSPEPTVNKVALYLGNSLDTDSKKFENTELSFEEFSADKAESGEYNNLFLGSDTHTDQLTAEQRQAVKDFFEGGINSMRSIVDLSPTVDDCNDLADMLGQEGIALPTDKEHTEKFVEIYAYGIKNTADNTTDSHIAVNYNEDTPYAKSADDGITAEDANRFDVFYQDGAYNVYKIDLDGTFVSKVAEGDVVVDLANNKLGVNYNGQFYESRFISTADGKEYLKEYEGDDQTIHDVTGEEPDSADKAKLTKKSSNETSKLSDELIEGIAEWAHSANSPSMRSSESDTAKVANKNGDSESQDPVDLLEVAQSYAGTLHATWFETDASALVNSYSIPVHVFENVDDPDGGYDIYNIYNVSTFNNSSYREHKKKNSYLHPQLLKISGEYSGSYSYNEKLWVGGAQYDEIYGKQWDLQVELPGIQDDSVVLEKVYPESINKQTQYTYSQGWSLGSTASGSVTRKGISAEGVAGLSLTCGYSSNEQVSFETEDIEVEKHIQDQSNLGWNYITTNIPKRKKRRVLTDPARLSVSSYGPAESWVWMIPTRLRSKYTGYTLKVLPKLGGTYMRNSDSLDPRNITMKPYNSSKKTEYWASKDITLTRPPLFATDALDVVFDSKAADSTLTVLSQGKFSIDDSYKSCGWITVTETTMPSDIRHKLLISVTKNTTGKVRQSDLTFHRLDKKGKTLESYTIKVTQSAS